MSKLIFQAERIKCEGCVNSIRTYLLSQKNVQEVSVNRDTQVIGVKYDGDLDPEDLKKGLESLGYPVKSWSPEGTKA
ncbi:MAG TPA: heavy metal-associated domain-containing protein [Bacteroidia bacterium]|nr:heavy metal-associated domain-containing protein [Bacteroidia bacterium]